MVWFVENRDGVERHVYTISPENNISASIYKITDKMWAIEICRKMKHVMEGHVNDIEKVALGLLDIEVARLSKQLKAYNQSRLKDRMFGS